MLVTLEGIDGAGKSTIWENIKPGDFGLQPEEITFTREPTDNDSGRLLREHLKTDEESPMTELFLFMADHANHVDSTIKPALTDSTLVISDRYIDSRCAYQGYSLRDLHPYPVEYVYNLHEFEKELNWTVWPTVTVFIDVPVEVALNRLGTEEKFETEKRLTKIKENYEYLIEKDPERFKRVDGTQDIDGVTESVIECIQSV